MHTPKGYCSRNIYVSHLFQSARRNQIILKKYTLPTNKKKGEGWNGTYKSFVLEINNNK